METLYDGDDFTLLPNSMFVVRLFHYTMETAKCHKLGGPQYIHTSAQNLCITDLSPKPQRLRTGTQAFFKAAFSAWDLGWSAQVSMSHSSLERGKYGRQTQSWVQDQQRQDVARLVGDEIPFERAREAAHCTQTISGTLHPLQSLLHLAIRVGLPSHQGSQSDVCLS